MDGEADDRCQNTVLRLTLLLSTGYGCHASGAFAVPHQGEGAAMRTRGDPERNQSSAPAGRDHATALRGRLSPEGLSCFSETHRLLTASPVSPDPIRPFNRQVATEATGDWVQGRTPRALPPSPHYSRSRLANNAGLTEALVLGGPGRIKHLWGVSTPRPSRGTRDGYPACLSPCVIPPRDWPLACKPGLFTNFL